VDLQEDKVDRHRGLEVGEELVAQQLISGAHGDA
jgi:hypothetical protein